MAKGHSSTGKAKVPTRTKGLPTKAPPKKAPIKMAPTKNPASWKRAAEDKSSSDESDHRPPRKKREKRQKAASDDDDMDEVEKPDAETEELADGQAGDESEVRKREINLSAIQIINGYEGRWAGRMSLNRCSLGGPYAKGPSKGPSTHLHR